MTEKENIYALLKGGPTNAKLAVKILEGLPQLEQAILLECQPLLNALKIKKLVTLPWYLERINNRISDQNLTTLLSYDFVGYYVTKISLFDHKSLAKITPWIAHLPNLTELEIYDLGCSELHPSIIQLTTLRKIYLNTNITHLIDTIGQLKELQQLKMVDDTISIGEKIRLQKLLPNCKISIS
jgi:Leucine-rich repeat (LRR) protein